MITGEVEEQAEKLFKLLRAGKVPGL